MKYSRALALISFLCPFIVRSAVEPGTAGGESKPPGEAAPAPAAAAAQPKALSASDFMAKLTAAFTTKEALAKENAEQAKRIESLQTELGTAQAAKAEAETAKTAAESAKSVAENLLDVARAALASFATAVGVKPDDIAGKPADEVQRIFNARIEARSGERLAELGFPVSGLPVSAETASKSGSGDDYADLQAQLATEKDPAKAGELAARANKLRDQKWNAAGRN